MKGRGARKEEGVECEVLGVGFKNSKPSIKDQVIRAPASALGGGLERWGCVEQGVLRGG